MSQFRYILKIYPLKNLLFCGALGVSAPKGYGAHHLSICEGGDLVSCDQKCGIPEVEWMHPNGASENVGKGVFFPTDFLGVFPVWRRFGCV